MERNEHKLVESKNIWATGWPCQARRERGFGDLRAPEREKAVALCVGVLQEGRVPLFPASSHADLKVDKIYIFSTFMSTTIIM